MSTSKKNTSQVVSYNLICLDALTKNFSCKKKNRGKNLNMPPGWLYKTVCSPYFSKQPEVAPHLQEQKK